MTSREAAVFFRSRDRFRILTHRSPDGDTIGCAVGLCRGLRAVGKNAFILENPQFTRRYAPWLEGLTMEPVGTAVTPEDTVVSVDVAAETLFPENAAALTGKVRFAVDHHSSNTGFARETLLDVTAAACGEVIYGLLLELGAPMDMQTAEALYIAVSTDTGCFQYSNTTAATLRIAAALRDAGIDAAALNRMFFGVKSLGRLRLEARLTESIELLAGGRVAVCRLPLAWIQELALGEDDLDNISSFPRVVEGVEAGITLREKKNDVVKLSLRTGPDVNASKICAHLGGGGHPAAAGATVKGTLDEAFAAVCGALAREGLEV